MIELACQSSNLAREAILQESGTHQALVRLRPHEGFQSANLIEDTVDGHGEGG